MATRCTRGAVKRWGQGAQGVPSSDWDRVQKGYHKRWGPGAQGVPLSDWDQVRKVPQGGSGIEVRSFRTFPQFRNFPQFSAIFRNFSAIFLTSRFSDCLPTLVQNNETFFFYYAIHSLMFQGHQILT